MFGFFKKRPLEVFAISNGEVIELTEVQDEVFSKKLAGDGVAIIPNNGNFTAPLDGVISRIFPTNHAFSIKGKNSIEIMVHIGLDTVELKGNGFKRLKEEGNSVKVGDTIIEVDLDYLKSNGKDTTTPIVANSEKEIIVECKTLGVVKKSMAIFKVNRA